MSMKIGLLMIKVMKKEKTVASMIRVLAQLKGTTCRNHKFAGSSHVIVTND